MGTSKASRLGEWRLKKAIPGTEQELSPSTRGSGSSSSEYARAFEINKQKQKAQELRTEPVNEGEIKEGKQAKRRVVKAGAQKARESPGDPTLSAPVVESHAS